MIALVPVTHPEGDKLISVRSALCIMLLVWITAAFGGGNQRAAAAQAAAHNPVVKPWVEEDPCRWWIDANDGGHRGSISPGNDGLVLSISDPVFLDWSHSGEHSIELLFDDDPRTRVIGQAWVTHVSSRPSSMFSIELDGAAVGKLAGAKRLTLFRDGRPVFAMDLAGTPGRTALEACIPQPGRGHGDAES
jgi:hypothetical protein